MVVINFVVAFGAGDPHLIGIDYNNIVAGIDVGGIFSLVLAAQTAGNLTGHTAQYFVLGVDHKPLTADGFWFRAICLHGNTPTACLKRRKCYPSGGFVTSHPPKKARL